MISNEQYDFDGPSTFVLFDRPIWFILTVRFYIYGLPSLILLDHSILYCGPSTFTFLARQFFESETVPLYANNRPKWMLLLVMVMAIYFRATCNLAKRPYIFKVWGPYTLADLNGPTSKGPIFFEKWSFILSLETIYVTSDPSYVFKLAWKWPSTFIA